jgi:hypothetical protein
MKIEITGIKSTITSVGLSTTYGGALLVRLRWPRTFVMALGGLVVWHACCDLGWWQWFVGSASPAAL